MTFQIVPLEAAEFTHLFGASGTDLDAAGAIPCVAEANPGFPCRVSLRDAKPGEKLFLVNYEHMGLPTPYRSAHALFVREDAQEARLESDEVPKMLARRMLSVRAFDVSGMMLDAEVVDGSDAAPVFERLLRLEGTAWLHIHSAARGCYLAKVIPTNRRT